MSATKILPEGYTLKKEIDLQKDLGLLVRLNIMAIILLPPVAYGLYWLTMVLRSKPATILQVMTPRISPLVYILALALALIMTMILHELAHGLVFWAVTHQVPKFGFRGAYAFAAAPNWFISRLTYFFIGAAPLVIISLIGIILIPVIPLQLLSAWLFGLLTNTIGAVGDIYILFILLRQPASTLIQDRGDAISFFTDTVR